MDDRLLVSEALLAREAAYAPYSHFAVGAALLCADGRIFRGCNIENAAFTPGNCAERTAIFKAISEGARNFIAIAIAGGPAGSPCTDFAYPCGVCRQVMMEFMAPSFRILVATDAHTYEEYTLQSLLPHGFGPHNLS